MRLPQLISIRVAQAFSEGRNRRLTTGVLSGIFTKGTGFALTLVTVPMTLGYLGPERYGVWVTMISMLAWLSLMDLGLANGLTPILSAAFGKKRDDLAQEYVSTAIWSLAGIAIITGSVLAVFWRAVDWGKVFNVQDSGLVAEISLAMALAVIFFLLRLPLAVNHRVLLAYQEGQKANALQLLTSITGVVGLYLVTKTNGGLVYLVIGYSGTQVLMAFAIFVWLYTWEKPQLRPLVVPKLARAKRVFSFGGLYLVMQLGALLVFQKDFLLITRFLGAHETASYSVAWQLFLYVNVVNLLLAPYIAPSFGEASASGDSRWVRLAFLRYLSGSVFATILFVLVIGFFYIDIIELWVGSAVRPTSDTIVWLMLWTLLYAFLAPAIGLLQGLGRLRRFTAYHFTASVSSFAVSLWLIPAVGVHGGIMATTICYAIILTIPVVQEVSRSLVKRPTVRSQ